jgi:hypothetical protein
MKYSSFYTKNNVSSKRSFFKTIFDHFFTSIYNFFNIFLFEICHLRIFDIFPFGPTTANRILFLSSGQCCKGLTFSFFSPVLPLFTHTKLRKNKKKSLSFDELIESMYVFLTDFFFTIGRNVFLIIDTGSFMELYTINYRFLYQCL